MKLLKSKEINQSGVEQRTSNPLSLRSKQQSN